MNEIIICFLLFASVFNISEDPEKVIAKTNNEFSFKIFRMLSKNENDVMSSLSILSAFSILMNGAKGETLLDMKCFLEFKNHLSDSSDQSINEGFQKITEKYQNSVNKNPIKGKQNKPELNMANRVIHDKQIKLKSEFKKVVEQYFKGEVQSADFQKNNIEETNKINKWVRNKTNNKIQKIFDKLERDTSIVILNVLYFKGDWTNDFDVSSTEKLNFYNNGVTPVKTDTMLKYDWFNYAESSELDSQVLEMDYLGNQISFVIVLPKERNGLKALKEKINSQNFNDVLNSIEQDYIKVFIPKFKVESNYDLMKEVNPKPVALTNIADLSGLYEITPEKPGSIVKQVKHKVFISIDEKGTEAAAVTAPEYELMCKTECLTKSVVFKADHPFLYFIRDKTNSIILFCGQIIKF